MLLKKVFKVKNLRKLAEQQINQLAEKIKIEF